MSVSERKFGVLPTGEEVKIYHLENKKGAYAEVLQYGAILVKICVPDKNGDLKDVVLGYDDIRGYEINGCFFRCDHWKKWKPYREFQIFY